MLELQSMSMRLHQGVLYLLDQTLLPHQQHWFAVPDVASLVEAIQRLQVRGAPAIGIAASLLLAVLASQGQSRQQLQHAAQTLRAARPTAVNLMNNIDSMLGAIAEEPLHQRVVETAMQLFLQDVALCSQLAEHGAALLQPGERVLTHCNTGGLATAGVGTALGVIAKAHQQGKGISVWVDETRPLLQGGRLTAWELSELGIPYQLICDNMAGMLMAQGRVDRIFVGADRIAANGDFANKVGTYSLAVLAQYHQVPFYVVAPSTTVDPTCPDGAAIPIEQRHADEVRGMQGAIGVDGSYQHSRWAPHDSAVYNPAFDVTPAGLVTGWVLEHGVFSQADIAAGALTRAGSKSPKRSR